ncbi:MAG: IPT/TIG domain-containing protein [Bryobacteraceae bacterium]
MKIERVFGLRPIRILLTLLLAATPALLPVALPAQTAPKYIISTFAGTGTGAYSGDSGKASEAGINQPWGMVLDSSGTLFLADQVNCRIRKIADGTISTVAGDGTCGYTADAVAATSSELSYPTHVAFNSSGGLLIADTVNHRIRLVASGGNISTVAGTGDAGYYGDDDKATSAHLNYPTGLAVDSSGNIFIGDTYNHVIRKVATDGKITTFAGNNTAGYSGDGAAATSATLRYPEGLAFDSAGNLYVADSNNHVIRKIDKSGIITTVAGSGTYGFSGDGGPATQATMGYPNDVYVDKSGNLYIVDTVNSRVRYVGSDGIIRTIAGNGRYGSTGDGGLATSAALRFPGAILMNSAGSLYLADTQNNKIRLLTPTSTSSGSAVPTIKAAGVVTAGEFGAFPSVAPGAWVEIYGTNLASRARSWTDSDFSSGMAPTSLEGTRVTIDGQPAYIAYVSPGQLNVQLPSNLAAGQKQLTVTTSAGTSTAYSVTVNSTQPGVYAPSLFKLSGMQFAGAVFPDGATFALPSGAVQGISARPARPGEAITLYGVGFGPVTPNFPAGEVVQALNSTEYPLEVYVGGARAAVTYAGLAPNAVGVYQINLVVPTVAESGNQALTFTLGGISGSQKLYVAVDR